MSKREKLLRRLASEPKDFTWPELVTLMTAFDMEVQSGSGSVRRFQGRVTKEPLHMHQPHPSNTLKRYQIRDAVDFLRREGILP